MNPKLRTKIGKITRRDITRKVVAVFFAILLYYTIYIGIEQTSRVFDVPVEIEYPTGLVNMDNSVKYVKVSVKGDSKRLDKLTSGALRCKVVISTGDYLPGAVSIIKITRDDVKIPFGFQLEKIEPNAISLNLEPLDSKKVRLRARFSGENTLSSDYRIAEVRFLPTEVTINGPATQVAQIRELTTMPIPIDHSVNESFEYTPDLRVPEGFTASPSRVNAEVIVVKHAGERKFTNLPVTVRSLPEQQKQSIQIDIEPRSVGAELTGPLSKLDFVRPQEILVLADITGLTRPGEYIVPLQCLIDGKPDIHIKALLPQQVKVKIK